MKHFGVRAKEWIVDHDIKQKTLAKELHITEAMLSNYLTGRNDMPVEVLVRLAQRFGVSMDYLVGLCDEPSVPMTLTDGERTLVAAYRTLSREQKELIAQNIRFMQEQNQK